MNLLFLEALYMFCRQHVLHFSSRGCKVSTWLTLKISSSSALFIFCFFVVFCQVRAYSVIDHHFFSIILHVVDGFDV